MKSHTKIPDKICNIAIIVLKYITTHFRLALILAPLDVCRSNSPFVRSALAFLIHLAFLALDKNNANKNTKTNGNVCKQQCWTIRTNYQINDISWRVYFIWDPVDFILFFVQFHLAVWFIYFFRFDDLVLIRFALDLSSIRVHIRCE